MRTLIGNTVKTETADYSFPTREQAEAFYMTLKLEHPEARHPKAQRPPPGHPRHPRRKGAPR